MPLSTDKIPNLPLNGRELSTYASRLLVDELEHREVPAPVADSMNAALIVAMANDFISRETAAYPMVTIELNVKLHYIEVFEGYDSQFQIEPVLHTMNTMEPKHPVMVRSVPPPMREYPGRGEVVAFQLTAKVENPNLVRVHYRIPIKIQKRQEPLPGQLYPNIITETLEYDPADVPECPQPVVIDQSAEVAALWGIRKEVMPHDSQDNLGHVDEAAAVMTPIQLAREIQDANAAAASHHTTGTYEISSDAVNVAPTEEKVSGKRHKKGWNKTHAD